MAFGKKTRTGSEIPEDEVPWEGVSWAYATVTAQTNGETLLDRLNAMGQHGWEAVSHDSVGVMTTVVMKRPI